MFRIAAYRRAADSVRALDTDLGTIAEKGGRAALEAIPGVGVSIGSAIAQMLTTGRWTFLDHLKGRSSPEQLFQSVPGIGPTLARRVCETLHVNMLEGLETAAHDGRLEQVRGFGHRRAAMVRAALAKMLARVRRSTLVHYEEPEVDLLLDVDREYRERTAAGELIKMPRSGSTRRERLGCPCSIPCATAGISPLYSNTARAHQLGREADWVVIYFHKDNRAEGQRTVVTETRGEAAGRRIVRGREAECRRYHASI